MTNQVLQNLEDDNGLRKCNLPCWVCPSSDATSVYMKRKPHLHCFSCGEDNYDEEMIELYLSSAIKSENSKDKSRPDKYPFPQVGEVLSITTRDIKKVTCEKYGVQTLFEKGEKVGMLFPFTDSDGNMCSQKIKFNKKEDEKRGRQQVIGLGNQSVLFGQHLFPTGGKFITITEGEEDTLAAYQMFKDKYQDSFEPAVVSIKNGAGAALGCCKRSWEYLNSFEKIIISFDSDEQGQKAAKRVASMFPGKARIMKMEKDYDANQYLEEGKTKEFINSWYSAEVPLMKGIRSFNSLWDDMTSEDTCTTIPWPWDGLNKKTYGMRTGELIVVKAPKKIGKTAFLREVGEHVRTTTDHNIGVVFLEENLKRTGEGFCSILLNKPIYLPDVECSLEEKREAHAEVSKGDRYHIFDPVGERTPENLFDKMLYFVKVCNCKVILLDHISMFAYDAVDADERRFLDKFINDLSQFVIKNDVCLISVIHVNDEGKTRGSRAPGHLCNLMIELKRDKMNSDSVLANTTEVIVEDNRFCGDSGLACKLYYDSDTGRMNELDDSLLLEKRQEKCATVVQFDDD